MEQLRKLRHDQAAALYDMAQRAIRRHQASLAYTLVLKAIGDDPDHEAARRLLGYQKYQGDWHTAYEIEKLQAGQVWDEKFGWLPESQLARYQQGQRFLGGRWISAEEDARRHRDIRSGWEIETEHYTIRTDHSMEAAVGLGVKLENLYRIWQQIFIRYYANEAYVAGLFSGHAAGQAPAAPNRTASTSSTSATATTTTGRWGGDAQARNVAGRVRGQEADGVFLRRRCERRADRLSRGHAPTLLPVGRVSPKARQQGQLLGHRRDRHVHGIAPPAGRLFRARRPGRRAGERRPLPLAEERLLRPLCRIGRLRRGSVAAGPEDQEPLQPGGRDDQFPDLLRGGPLSRRPGGLSQRRLQRPGRPRTRCPN